MEQFHRDPYDEFIASEHESVLASYRSRPDNIRENAGQEQSIIQGGYRDKQIQELIQNAVDALDEDGGVIRIVLTDGALYAANDGAAFDEAGIRTLLHSNMSDKRDNKIGRFGLGFKSVLQVSGRPQIFGVKGSFGFDAARSRAELEGIAPHLGTYPALRLPYVLDPAGERAQDPVLDELMDTATTVVRLPLAEPSATLEAQIHEFPYRFLLFTQQVSELVLDDRISGITNSWSADRRYLDDEGSVSVTLRNGGLTEVWLVVSMAYRPTAAAQEEAGAIHARGTVPVSWAVRQDSGTKSRSIEGLWNYFPTTTEVTIPGIINAPFKMNDDRMSVLYDRYNEEILSHALGRLMLLAVPYLRTEEHPAGHFRLAPARGREDTPWMRDRVITPLVRFLSTIAFVPDLKGELRPIRDLKVRPDIQDDHGLIAAWTEIARVAGVTAWAHEDALESTFNAAFVNRLNSATGRSRTGYQEWIEALAKGDTPSAYAAALVFADVILKRHMSNAELLGAVRAARIVPLEDGTISTLGHRLYFPDGADPGEPGIVASDFVDKPGVREILRNFGVSTLSGTARLAIRLQDALNEPSDGVSADSFWLAAEQFQPDEVLTVLRKGDPHGMVPVRTASGRLIHRSTAWRKGAILDPAREKDANLTLAPSHPFLSSGSNARQADIPSTLPALRRLAPSELPAAWRMFVKQESAESAVRQFGKNASASVGLHTEVFATPRLQELDEVSVEARAAVTAELLSRPQDEVVLPVTYTFEGPGRRKYSQQETERFPGPDLVWIRRHGVFRTAYGLLPVGMCCSPVEGVPDNLLPVPSGTNASAAVTCLGLPAVLSDSQWRTTFRTAENCLDPSAVQQLYGYAARAGAPRPLTLLARIGEGRTEELPTAECLLPGDDATLDHLRAVGKDPFISVGSPDIHEALADLWGLNPLVIRHTTVIRHENTDDEPTRFTVRFPHLRQLENKVKRFARYSLQPVTSLQLVTSNDFDDSISVDDSHSVVADPDEKLIYHRSGLRDKGLLGQILDLVGSRQDPNDLLVRMKEIEAENRRSDFWDQLSQLGSDQDRVVRLIGEEGLRQLVPDSAFDLLRADGDEITEELLYRLAQNVHGGNLWKAVLGAMPEDGDARAWVQDAGRKDLDELGFSEDMYATRSTRSKPSREELMGPVALPDLHPYQQEVAHKVLDTLAADHDHNRGLMQLPTGAGKTRVAVQSLIEHVRRTLHTRHLIVWIAGQEELCEQAVEAWTSAWPTLGTPGERMVVSRMWGTRTGIVEEDAHLHVVVATYQTLTRIAKRATEDSPEASKFAWLADPDVVVIDEAHGAIAGSFTSILQWFHRSTRQKGKPLLGLSATPFRGTSEEETKRLVQRFGGNLIEPSSYFTAATAHTYLQRERVLAQVRQEELEGSVLRQRNARSTDDDPWGDERKRMLESRIDLEALAQDENRNLKIVQHIVAHQDTVQHAIVFGASVQHAQALAAVLDSKGIPAATIHGGTPMEHRRRLIQRFRDGDLQVLTNFDVLSQGFDAPKVDTVYMCRPTFSPNKYLQMIGRGLRGPLNGGSEEVLIVNVKDNLANFGEDLAYTEFEYLWQGDDDADEQ